MHFTDSFSLLKNARTIGANERRYAIEKVDQLFKSPTVQQALKLRELYGYYGHGLREMTGRLDVPEVAVIKVGNQPVITTAVPSNVCVDISIDTDTGIVTHTEDVLESTETGKVVKSMLDGKVGGWSWATRGDDGMVAIPRVFKGFDFVTTPNYVSLFHPASEGLMMESAGVVAGGRQYTEQGVMFLESMQAAGYGQEAIDAVIDDMQKRVVDLDLIANYREQAMILEAVAETRALELTKYQSETAAQIAELTALNERRTAMFLESVQTLPVFVSNEQKQALMRMETDRDVAIVRNLFESVAKLPSGKLPNIGQGHEGVHVPPHGKPVQAGFVVGFNSGEVPKFY